MLEGVNIINLYTVDIKTWIEGPNNVYVGRPVKGLYSKWKNPYKIKRNTLKYRKVAIKRFKDYVQKNKDLLNSTSELKDKILGCWCAPKLCHAEVLHRLAGNNPIYQQKHTTMENRSNTENKTVNDLSSLSQQVTEALRSMNEVLDNVSLELIETQSSTPVAVNGVATPDISSMTTVELNNIYETLLDSSSATSSRNPSNNTTQTTNCDQSDLVCKLRSWRETCSRSLQSSPLSKRSNELLFNRKTRSAPASPAKNVIELRHNEDTTVVDPPSPFLYDSMSNSKPNNILEDQTVSDDATRKILEFLASKVDLLTITINALQFNVTKLTESVQVNLEENIPDKIQTLENWNNGKLDYIETSLESYKKILDKEMKALKEENTELRSKLDNYISEETERDDSLRECLNSPQNVPNCITDLSPLRDELDKKLYDLRDELDKKLYDLDVRLIECEQYSRRESIVISGIPESVSQRNLQQKVIEILSLIGLNIAPNDISACHRLFKPTRSQYPAKVIVRFVNRKIVNICLQNRANLQEEAYKKLRLNLRFYESLCSKNEETLRICNFLSREHKIHGHFLRNGFSKVVIEENGRPEKIKHPDQLRKKFPCIPAEM